MKYFYDNLKGLLEQKAEARERKNKHRAVAYLLVKKYPQLRELPRETLVSIVKDSNGMDRAWRKVTEVNENLRGRDYGMKEQLEQEAQIEMGYEVGYRKDIKMGTLFKD